MAMKMFSPGRGPSTRSGRHLLGPVLLNLHQLLLHHFRNSGALHPEPHGIKRTMKVSRRGFLRLGAALVGGGALGGLGIGLREPHEIVVNRIEIALRRLPAALDGLRVAQLSDIHFDSFLGDDHVRRAVELTNAERPDLAVITGDFITADPSGSSRNHKAIAERAYPCAQILNALQAPLGRFAVLGNHDYEADADIVADALHSGGSISVLRNQTFAIEKSGARMWLAGIDNLTFGRARPEKTLHGVPGQECTLAAIHEPDIADRLRHLPVDLQISGHSHGGQIRLPLVGALFLPRWARKYPRGLYQLGEMQLYTNSGIGVIGLPMRLFCPPEVTIFTLRTEQRAAG